MLPKKITYFLLKQKTIYIKKISSKHAHTILNIRILAQL